MRALVHLTVVSLLAGCGSPDASDAPTDLALARLEAPLPESDQLPAFEMSLGGVALGRVLDAALDEDTSTLTWIDPSGTLWAAPLATAPTGARALAERVLPGLAIARGRLAFAVRVDGPETSPFLADLRTDRVIALDDAPGPDEIMGFSPDGEELLLLSGRTGLASLFAVGVDRPTIRQLTNAGLRPGPALDRAKVTPAPVHRSDVTWTASGIRYRADDAVVHLSASEVAR